MNTYAGLHARYYDVVYGEKAYVHEARFVDSLIRDSGTERGRLLDVACEPDGTRPSSRRSDGT